MKVLTTSSNVNSIGLEVAASNSSLNLDDPLVQATGYALLDPNVKLSNKSSNDSKKIVTLNYEEVLYKEQPLATRVENVNPYAVTEYVGSIKLTPEVDTWVKTVISETGKKTIVKSSVKKFISKQNPDNVIGKNKYNEYSQVGTDEDQWIRSRNIAFDASGFIPFTQYYLFFDGQSKNLDIIPKLIEVTMVSGVFTPGETVKGTDGDQVLFTAVVCDINHKEGALTAASGTVSKKYKFNPYDQTIDLTNASYSNTSTILNIDIQSLAKEALGEFSGYIKKGLTLKGQSSSAEATVDDIRLISDGIGDLKGSLFIRDPYDGEQPKIELGNGKSNSQTTTAVDPNKVAPVKFTTGIKTFKLTSSDIDAPSTISTNISSAEATYQATGIIEGLKQVTVTVKKPPPPVDPLAQTFYIDSLESGNTTGMFLTSADVFFATKDDVQPVTLSIVTVELGIPTTEEIASVTKQTEDVNVNPDNPVVPTKFTFDYPIFLSAGLEYAIVIKSPSTTKYTVWVATMGEQIVGDNAANLTATEKSIYSKNAEGSLFKSQNSSTWTPDQLSDLKYKLYKCNFNQTSGTVYLYNQSITPKYSKLSNNPITTYPQKLKIGFTTTTNLGNIFVPGANVSDTTTGSPVGTIEQVGSEISTITVTGIGTGYDVTGTYTNVDLYPITGSGSGAKATIGISNGVISSSTITTSGSGYVVGDLLGITTSQVGGKGKKASITVSTINGINTLYLTNVVNGEFTVGQPLSYQSGQTFVSLAGTTITSNVQYGGSLYAGNVFKVNHFDHGMHSVSNKVVIDGVKSNIEPTTLTADYVPSNTTVSIANTTLFSTFEGVAVSAANTGYIKINTEILGYTAITPTGGDAGTLTIISKAVDGGKPENHSSGSQVYKYELGGVSLLRINKQHDMSSINRDSDFYYLQFTRTDKPTLNFNSLNTLGENDAYASKNVQFNKINPKLIIEKYDGDTDYTAQIRTVTGTSVGGNEASFVDQGFEPINLNQENSLSSVRLVASKVNEQNQPGLSGLQNNRSFTLAVNLTTKKTELSPVINLASGSNIELTRSILNNPVSDYAFDSRVNALTGDPHSSIYVTNKINLKQPATSLKVLVDAYRHSSSDFRVLYQLFRPDSKEVDQSYELFPGYDNLKDTDGDGYGDEIIDKNLNNGKSDAFVPASGANEFFEYQFSVDDLEQFNAFKIKIVMSGENEAYAPLFKNLRVIALA